LSLYIGTELAMSGANLLSVGMLHHYMGTPQQSRTRVSTGILSDGEREFFRGEKEVKDEDGYQRNARYRARQRMDQIEEDLDVLREAGQEDLVEEFVNRFGRVERLEREVEELRAKLDEDDGH